MRALRTAATSLGWLVLLPAWAQSSFDAHPQAGADTLFREFSSNSDDLLFGARHEEIRASYPLSPRGDRSVFGYIGSPGAVALGPSSSFMRTHGGLDVLEAVSGGHWLYPENNASEAFTVGYAWRHLTVERSVFSSGNSDRPANNKNLFKLDSRSVRLSYKASPNLTLQLSRGSLSGLDQLVPNGDVRRTTISATYRRAFPESEWQTTLAWGRNARKSRETVVGYLLESTYRFSGANVVFGRLEQVGSDELARESDSLRVDPFKMNKLSVGYFRDVTGSSRMKFDVGILASRHFVPSSLADPRGSNPIAYMAFIRLKPQ